MFKVNQVINETTFPSVGLLYKFNLPGRKLTPSYSKIEIINESDES